jgi:exopolyphosphatase/guanosine-5'-triphosphate,3'-diphosphate pyrophosphatase
VPRIAVVDLGTNSTRLLVADVTDGHVANVERRTAVTRLGQGVDAAGRGDEAMTHLKRAVAIFAEVGEPDTLQPAIWQLVEW